MPIKNFDCVMAAHTDISGPGQVAGNQAQVSLFPRNPNRVALSLNRGTGWDHATIVDSVQLGVIRAGLFVGLVSVCQEYPSDFVTIDQIGDAICDEIFISGTALTGNVNPAQIFVLT